MHIPVAEPDAHLAVAHSRALVHDRQAAAVHRGSPAGAVDRKVAALARAVVPAAAEQQQGQDAVNRALVQAVPGAAQVAGPVALPAVAALQVLVAGQPLPVAWVQLVRGPEQPGATEARQQMALPA